MATARLRGGSGREAPIISNGRLAVLVLLASEAMLFAGFIGSFLVYKLSAPFWPPPGLPRLPLQVTWINTFVLLSQRRDDEPGGALDTAQPAPAVFVYGWASRWSLALLSWQFRAASGSGW